MSENKALREAIKQALLEAGKDEMSEVIDSVEKVKDPDKYSERPEYGASVNESVPDQTAIMTEAVKAIQDKKELWAPHDKEHLRDNRMNLYKELVKKVTKGKK